MRDAVVALKAAFSCDAVNVGVNLGAAAGGSQSDHLHVHCVPRWAGRRQLHRGGRRDPRPPDQPRGGGRPHPRRLACAEPPAGTVAGAMADDVTRDDEVTDALPDDLNASEWVGPYVFPNNNRRRVPGLPLPRARRALHRRVGGRRVRRRARERGLPLRRGPAAAPRRLPPAWPAGTSTSTSATPSSPPPSRSASRWATPRRSWAGGACAAGRPGGSSCTPPRSRRRSAASCWWTASTARSSPTSWRTTRRTGATSVPATSGPSERRD